ncbi:MAG: hypothetical protein FD137_267 [Spirochaetes bacterium]|nr:MAG: hypothetical protein FD137_267 [Spirochaetota bacterium]
MIQCGDAKVVDVGKIPGDQDFFTRSGLPFLYRQENLPSHHLIGDSLAVHVRHLVGADHAAVPHHRDPVAELEDFIQLVADENDSVAVGPELLEFHEELVGFLGGEDGSGLVQNKNLGSAVEGLEYLKLLAHGNRDVHHPRAGEHLQVVLVRQLLGYGHRVFQVEDPASALAWLLSQYQVFARLKEGTSMKCWCTIPIPAAIASWEDEKVTALPFR